MSEFEYVAVLVSLVLGLGIANILTGIGRMINRRSEFSLDLVHIMWSLALFVVLVLNWWVFFQLNTFTEWSFEFFLVVVIWAVFFYLMSVVLYPIEKNTVQDYGLIFEKNRPWFLGLFIASNLSDIALTALRGQLLNPPFYLPFVLHFVVLGIIGLLTNSRRYHTFLASYVFGISLTWAFWVRLLLGN
ncbi:hypothetical protein [Aliikangiella coralliicola]|uniref:Uncharacterized protein n=1 Tax=Aliikangiella coralliicola TaxID=2592383 RepID=A0A545U4H8_9GAMM|nr:hypothetical protein [Aliikangiella coralliicola]TQV84378.1 hypothetical protein FLL46_22405 [Aliikangiella coralliicola]